MGMESNFLRLYGDLMERELIWTRGCLVKPQCPTGRIAFLYMKDIVNALAKIWLPRWSVAKIWRFYSMYEWDTMWTLVTFDRGARLIATVMWRVAKMKIIIFEETRVVFYMEDNPVMWPETNFIWAGQY